MRSNSVSLLGNSTLQTVYECALCMRIFFQETSTILKLFRKLPFKNIFSMLISYLQNCNSQTTDYFTAWKISCGRWKGALMSKSMGERVWREVGNRRRAGGGRGQWCKDPLTNMRGAKFTHLSVERVVSRLHRHLVVILVVLTATKVHLHFKSTHVHVR